MENEIMYIKLDDIIPNRFQPREVFDENSLNKLADSIRQHGVIEPILVRPVSNKYEIIAGERRYKASVLAGLTKIPAMVRKLDDKESSIIAFIENEHRSDVSAIEEARTMDRILKNNNMTQEELAKELGINQSTIANKIRLLNLPLEVQEAVMRNEISERHARSLLSVKDEQKQKELLTKIKEKRMSVRELDSEIKSMNENINNNQNMNMEEPLNNNINSNNSGSNPPFGGPLDTSGIMSFLNNYDSPNQETPEKPQTEVNNNDDYSIDYGNPTPESEPVMPTPEPTNDNGFMSFLNNFNVNNDNPLPPEEPQESVENNMDYSTDYNNPLSQNEPIIPTPESTNDGEDIGFMQFLNDYDNKNPLPPEEPQENVENNVDNSMEYNSPLPQSEPIMTTPKTTIEPPIDNGFMNFLNDYDNKNTLPPEEPQQSVENNIDNSMDYSSSLPQSDSIIPTPELPRDNGYMDFSNNFNNNPMPPEEPKAKMDMNNSVEFSNPLPTMEPTIPSNEPITSNMNYSAPENNVMINNVTPPVTSNFNQYVEDNENYVDISKQAKITSVDEVISKLSGVIQEIKEKSIYKVDTEEINFDDIYQITIKIDKRDY